MRASDTVIGDEQPGSCARLRISNRTESGILRYSKIRPHCPSRVKIAILRGVSVTDGLPLTTDAPLQRSDLAKSAINGRLASQEFLGFSARIGIAEADEYLSQ